MQRTIAQAIITDPDQNAFIQSILTLYSHIKCNVCQGEGHNSLNCATKKALDRSFRDFGLRAEWGGIKSQMISDNVNVAKAIKADIQRIRSTAKDQMIQKRIKEGVYISYRAHYGVDHPDLIAEREQARLQALAIAAAQAQQQPQPAQGQGPNNQPQQPQGVPDNLRPPPDFPFNAPNRGPIRATGSKTRN